MNNITNKLRIGLDVDGVCLDFTKSFIEECKKNEISLYVEEVWNFFEQDLRSYDVFNSLKNDFWLNLKREEASKDINFIPTAYISHRSCPTAITRQSLINNGLPDAPVFHVKYTEDKLKLAKELKLDLFIDDRASTVTYFLENGIKAKVLHQIWNKRFINIPRIKTLGELNEK